MSAILAALLAASAAASDCDRDTLRASLRAVDRDSYRGDVETRAQALSQVLARCRLTSDQLGLVPRAMERALRRGHESELSAALDQASDRAPYARVDEPLTRAQRWAARLGRLADVESRRGELLQRAQEARGGCGPVDFRSSLPPVRHQGELGWCYAYAAADLLSHRLGRPVSALDVAMLYNERWWAQLQHGLANLMRGSNPIPVETGREGGFTAPAARAAVERGVCWEEDLPSQRLSGSITEHVALIRKVERFAEEVSRRRLKSVAFFSEAGDNPGAAPVETGAEVAEIARDVARTAFADAKKVFPNLTLQIFERVLTTRSRVRLIQALADASCRRQPVAGLAVTGDSHLVQRERELYRRIQAQLAAGKPVAIGYDADVLYRRPSGTQRANHASVLVGRRWNERHGRCELLLRNSWGPSCSGYSSEYECREGHLWIPAQYVMKATLDSTYLTSQ